MGDELPAAMGVRLDEGDNGQRIVSFIGDGTFLMAPTELVTGAQEGLDVTHRRLGKTMATKSFTGCR